MRIYIYIYIHIYICVERTWNDKAVAIEHVFAKQQQQQKTLTNAQIREGIIH